jgi:hypothetical protein
MGGLDLFFKIFGHLVSLGLLYIQTFGASLHKWNVNLILSFLHIYALQ